MKAIYTLLTLLIPFVGFGQGPASHTIYAYSLTFDFSPSVLNINTNDTVNFNFTPNSNAIEVSESTYNEDGSSSNGGFQFYANDFHVFTEVGTYYYVCNPWVDFGMKGIINVNATIEGQWYADLGDYLQITNDSFFVYIFEEDCYEIEEFSYELSDSLLILNDEEGQISFSIFDITQESFSIVVDGDSVSVFDTSFDASQWMACVEYSWNCSKSSCVELMDNSGAFMSLEECESECEDAIEPTFDCISAGICMELMDGNGEFSSLDDCINACLPIADSWNCDEDACVEVSDGTGAYSTLIDCEQKCQNVTSIIENNISVNIFPNPSSNIFNIDFFSVAESKISVTNVLGEIVYFEVNKSSGEFNVHIDLSNHSKGIYNLTIISSDGIRNNKLILQ